MQQVIIPDVQGSVDNRQVPIKKVGIKAIKHPIKLPTKSGETQFSISETNMYVNLPGDQKGTHMSRFIQLTENLDEINVNSLSVLLDKTCELLKSDCAYIEMHAPFFINKAAPVSGIKSLMDYQLRFDAQKEGGSSSVWVEFLVPVTSLCPCSKEISNYGAHNQRSHLIVKVLQKKHEPFEDIITSIEKQASCELYGVLKRPDEKFITEKAYENPKFVEDIVRDVALVLQQNDNIIAYKVSSENFESIHNHSAYAFIEQDKR